MRAIMSTIAAASLLCACTGQGPTAEEEALPQTGSDPEVTANSAAAGMNASTAGSGMDRAPGGPVSDQGSGQGDTAPGL